jgi:bifunctional ADP-heptose synthase (sugar kinase/adenylyltransferase)
MNQPQESFRILLLGDSCYDYYHYGTVTRISPEAPIPIFDHLYTQKKLGMMSNVLENFRALGVEPDYQTHFFENKNRYIDRKSKQQLLRVDQKIDDQPFIGIAHELNAYEFYDTIVISDYNKGFTSYDDIHQIRKEFDGANLYRHKENRSCWIGRLFLQNQSRREKKIDFTAAIA